MDPRRNPGLNGILQWSLAQGGDGTAPSGRTSEEDRSWLASALQSMTVDEAKRMRDLGACLRETVGHKGQHCKRCHVLVISMYRSW